MDLQLPLQRQAYQDFINDGWILPSQDALSRGFAIVRKRNLDVSYYMPESLEFYKAALFVGDYVLAKFYHSILAGRFRGTGTPLFQMGERYHDIYTDYILAQKSNGDNKDRCPIILWVPVINFDHAQVLSIAEFLRYYNSRGWHPISYERDGIRLENHFPDKWVRTGVLKQGEDDFVTHEPEELEEPKVSSNVTLFKNRKKRRKV